jgi:hypothetical protein
MYMQRPKGSEDRKKGKTITSKKNVQKRHKTILKIYESENYRDQRPPTYGRS